MYDREERRKNAVRIADQLRMRENDGTATPLHNLLTLPIKAADIDLKLERFEPKDDDDTPPAELELVRDNFTLPPHHGGMTLPFVLHAVTVAIDTNISGIRVRSRLLKERRQGA